MFFGKKSNEETAPKPLWDDRQIKYLVDASSFHIRTTSVTATQGFGTEATYTSLDIQVYGITLGGKFMPVEFEFGGFWDEQDFGCWSIETRNTDTPHPFPLLTVSLNDPEMKIRTAICEAHKAALLSGSRGASVRINKAKGDGEHFADGNTYPITGLRLWAEYEKSDLPSWAYPIADVKFKWEGKPDSLWNE